MYIWFHVHRLHPHLTKDTEGQTLFTLRGIWEASWVRILEKTGDFLDSLSSRPSALDQTIKDPNPHTFLWFSSPRLRQVEEARSDSESHSCFGGVGL